MGNVCYFILEGAQKDQTLKNILNFNYNLLKTWKVDLNYWTWFSTFLIITTWLGMTLTKLRVSLESKLTT